MVMGSPPLLLLWTADPKVVRALERAVAVGDDSEVRRLIAEAAEAAAVTA